MAAKPKEFSSSVVNYVPKIKPPEGHSIHHICCPHDCPDTCSMLVTKNDTTGKAVSVQGDPSHPITRGYLCNKVNHYIDLVYNENRVLYPHRRVGPKGPGAKFERISWDEALEAITDDFKKTIKEYGSEAVQPFSYSGTLGMLGYWTMDQRFFNKMEAARLEQSICIYAAMWAGLYTYGLSNGPHVGEAARDGCELMILWATNLVSTGVHSIPFIREAKERGMKLVVVDPRKTRTTMFADVHIQPKPGTDAFLANAMIKVIVDNNLHDVDFLNEQTHGWEEFVEKVLPDYTLEEAEKITGVKAKDIEDLAIEYAKTKKSYIRANYGLNRHQNSGQMCRAVLILPCFNGSWREEKCGGVAFGQLEEMWLRFDLGKLHRPDLGNRAEKRIVNMVQIGNCTPNSGNVRKGMMRDDLFITVHETFWTDSCMYADIILPADTALERTDCHWAYGSWFLGINKPVIEPLGESINNTELFRMLADKMGYVDSTDNAFTQTDEEIIKDILLEAENEDGERFNCLTEGIDYDDVVKNGWARASTGSKRRDFLKNGWPTPSGKIEIKCEAITAEYPDVSPFPEYVPEINGQYDPNKEKFPIQVLSSASHYFIGDSFQSVPRLQAMQSRPTVEISLGDAKVRGIEDGDLVRLYNDNGETYCYAVLIEGLLDGVCATQKQFKGSNTPGGLNVNNLNSEMLTDFGKSPTFYSVLVEIEKASEEMTKKAIKQGV